MNKITPLVKGIITGALMLAISLLLIYTKQPAGSGLEYIGYFLYAGGIAWTLIAYSRSDSYTAKFWTIFGQGFRCFIIVTMITVIFVGTYSSTLDINKIGEDLRKELIKEDQERIKLKQSPKRLPNEIDQEVNNFKNRFVTTNIALAIFGTLIMGTIFTAAGTGILLMRRK